MIEDADEQLSDEPQDEEELETGGRRRPRPPCQAKESERKNARAHHHWQGQGFSHYDEVNDHMPEASSLPTRSTTGLDLCGEGIEIVDSASQVRVPKVGRGGR